MISPTQLLISYLRIPTTGKSTADHDGRCVMCGGHYAVGDPCEAWKPTASFTDFADLQNPWGTHVCGACLAVNARGKDFMQDYTKSIVCKGGVFGFFSNDAVAHWLVNPPEPPYLAFISTQKLGHIAWKAPVNLSRERMVVRYNDKTLVIRRAHLLESIEAAKALSEAKIADEIAKAAEKKGKKIGRPTAFRAPVRLEREMENPESGALAPWVDEIAAGDPALMRAAHTLRSATVGEIWGLTHILYAKTPGSELKLKPGA
ncbi:MAG: type IV CRISPR-associated protein Csf1 [Pigmentiphaga sp.]|jgi:CRISPR type IV-associated protein Csf1|nr:type IV CRISPR-associated protein Csf1 [Aromatoleum aromaticum]